MSPPSPQRPRAGFEAASAAVADVEGWMTPGQARRLWDCASEVSRAGRSSRSAASGAARRSCWPGARQRTPRLVAIDPHAGNDRGPQEIEGSEEHAAADHEVFNDNLEEAGVSRQGPPPPQVLRTTPSTTSPAPIDLLYIDGAHRFRPALDDIRAGERQGRAGRHAAHPRLVQLGRRHRRAHRRAVLQLVVSLRRALRVDDRLPARARSRAASGGATRPAAGAASVVRPQRRDQGPDRRPSRPAHPAAVRARPVGLAVLMAAPNRSRSLHCEDVPDRAPRSLDHRDARLQRAGHAAHRARPAPGSRHAGGHRDPRRRRRLHRRLPRHDQGPGGDGPGRRRPPTPQPGQGLRRCGGASTRPTVDLLTILDADLEYDPADFPDLLRADPRGRRTRSSTAARSYGGHAAYSFWFVLGNKGLALWASFLFDAWLTDIETCLKVAPTELWRRVDLQLQRLRHRGRGHRQVPRHERAHLRGADLLPGSGPRGRQEDPVDRRRRRAVDTC